MREQLALLHRLIEARDAATLAYQQIIAVVLDGIIAGEKLDRAQIDRLAKELVKDQAELKGAVDAASVP